MLGKLALHSSSRHRIACLTLASLIGFGCAAEVDPSDTGLPPDENVGVSTQAVVVGTQIAEIFDRTWHNTLVNPDWSDIGVVFSRYVRADGSHPQIGILRFANQFDGISWLPVTGALTAVKQDGEDIYLGLGNSIVRYGIFGNTKITSVNGAVTGPMAIDSSRIYYCDGQGLWKVSKSGGTPTRLVNTGSDRCSVIGRDGVVYYHRHRSSDWQLRRVNVDGTSDLPMYTQTPSFNCSTWDASFLYCVDWPTATTSRLRRVARATNVVSTLRTVNASMTPPRVRNGDPNGDLWWSEILPNTDRSDIMHRVGSTGAIRAFGLADAAAAYSVYPAPDSLYWAEWRTYDPIDILVGATYN